jgi:large subunit ribosomal protein L18
MKKGNIKELGRKKRHRRIRKKVRGTAQKPRLVVKRSLLNLYAQVINDEEGRTMLSISTAAKEAKDQLRNKTKIEQSRIIGTLLAKKCSVVNIKSVIFDRGGYKYHGRVKAFAEGAREGGLSF